MAALGATHDIGAELGGGGMSRTFVATERALNRRVVVKVLAPELLAGVSVERFKREVMLAASLQHPHVVPVLATGDADGLPWFTMPFVEGLSLRQRLAEGALGIGETIGILRDVARGLAFAHARGVVHRDIKPDNVLLSEGSATVTDFGIAKAISAARTTAGSGALTGTGMSIGTPAYMAPEQAAGDPDVDHHADLYAYGAMAYEMLTGAAPFAGRSPAKMLAAALSERPRPIEQLRPDVPAPLAKVVMACLEKGPSDRPNQATDIVRVLDSVLSSGAGVAAPVILQGGRVPVGRALGLWAASTALVLFVVWAASISVGLPKWAMPMAGGVMLLGLPVILFTWYAQRIAYRQFTMTPAFTPGGGQQAHGTLHTMAVKASPHLSWRRTALGGAIAVGLFVVGVGGFMVARAYGIGPAGSLIGRGELERNTRLILADFKSPASDTALGVTLTEALRADLAQSRSMRVLSRANVRDVLRLMRRPVDVGVDLPLAREVATREGIKAIVDGEIVQLGNGYVVAARLVTTQTGEELGAFRETAATSNDLLPAVERLSRALRERVGDSFKDIRDAKPLERVTTASVEALKFYVQGMRAAEERRDIVAARSYLTEAIRLDSGFASAYRKLAVTLSNERGSQEEISRLLTKAYQSRDRLSESERLLTEASYFTSGPREDLRQAAMALETLVERDTLFFPASNNLAVLFMRQGEWKQAEPLLRRAIRVEPGIQTGWLNLTRILLEQGRAAEALALQDSSQLALGPQNAQPMGFRGWIALDQGRYADADSITRLSLRTTAKLPVDVSRAMRVLAASHLTQGRVRAGIAAYAEVDSADRQGGVPVDRLGSALGDAAARALLLGDVQGARAAALAALRANPPASMPAADRRYGDWARDLFALGLTEQANAFTRDLERRTTESNRLFDEVRLAEVRGASAMAAGRTDEALRLWKDGMTRFKAAGIQRFGPDVASAYQKLNQPDSAIATLEAYLATPGFVRTFSTGVYETARSHQKLGELYEAKGKPLKALEHYEAFVELYKNADPELQVVVRDVRGRIERLRKATFKG